MFDLESAETSADRMAALERFIEFWLGPRKPEFGEPEAALAAGPPMPAVLRRFYAFAGRWPGRSEYANAPPTIAFSHQDSLRPLERVELADDGRLVFLDENQGVWACATEVAGDDPPVWVTDLDANGWRLASESLSRFLVTFSLQELLLDAPVQVGDDAELVAAYESAPAGDVVPLWRKGPGPWEDVDYTFHLWRGEIMVSEMFGSITFSGTRGAGAAMLHGIRAQIARVMLTLAPAGQPAAAPKKPGDGLRWDLTIERNGSGSIRVMGVDGCEAAVPAGTFPFDDVSSRLVAESAIDGGTHVADAAVFVWQRGDHGGRGRTLSGRSFAGDLFKRAIAAAQRKGASFDRCVAQDPPRA